MSMPQTKDDERLEASLTMRDVAMLLTSFDSAIDKALTALSNPIAEPQRQEIAKTLTDIKSALHTSSSNIKAHVICLDTVPNVNYAHSRLVTRKKRPALQEIAPPQSAAPVLAPVPKRRKASVPNVVLPAPASGAHYSKRELVVVVTTHALGKENRSHIVNKIHQQKLVPCSKSQINRTLKRYEQDKVPLDQIDKPWGLRGRDPLLTDEGMKSVAKDLQDDPDLTFDQDCMQKAMTKQVEANLRSRGIVPLNVSTTAPTLQSVRNYQTLLGAEKDVSISRTAIPKSHTRFTAENSLRSTMSFIATAATTHFVLGVDELPEVSKDLEISSESVKFLFEEISKLHNGRPLQPVRRAYIFSTDDTTECVFEGACPKNPKNRFVLVSSKNLSKHGTRSKFSFDSSEPKAGLRVKLTYTFAANGTVAPLFVSICGLTEQELPTARCPSGALVLKCDKLSLNGKVGTVIFVRNDGDKQTDKVRHRAHRDRILLPFCDDQRKDCDGWKEGDTIDDSMRIVSWCDGDINQIKTIFEEESLSKYESKKIIANKQSAARSGTEQAADLTKVFKSTHFLSRIATVEDVDEFNHPIKKAVTKGFVDMQEKGLNLALTKRKALIDFLSCIPELQAKTCTRDNIVHGFVENGLVGSDKTKNGFPDFNHMLDTVRRTVKDEEFALCKSSLSHLLKVQSECGHVSDEVYDQLGFPMDKAPNGEEVSKTATISQEQCQRAKQITHPYQKHQREEREDMHIAEEKRKLGVKNNKFDKLIKNNEACQAKLQGKEVTFEALSQCKAPELQAFVHVRASKTTVAPPKDHELRIPKTKGNWKDAANGVPNLIKLAHECKDKPVIIQAPSPPAVHSPVSNKRHEEAIVVSVSPRQTKFENNEKASSFLKNEAWVDKVKTALDPSDRKLGVEIDDEALQRADDLQEKLEWRMQRQVEKRIRDKCKWNHWVLKWAGRNIPPMAAVMVLMGHIAPDVKVLGEDETLLASTRSFFQMTRRDEQWEGMYLHYDFNRVDWIRSGKVVGRNFGARKKEHKLGAKLTTVESQRSKFYTLYPSEDAILVDEDAKKGEHEKLGLFTGIAFNKMFKGKLAKDFKEEGGIFHFDADTKRRIEASNLPGTSKLENKQMHCLGYLWELAYDLCICRRNNVSGSFGFEPWLREL